jgi:ribosomal protein S18 acetylase RimI-like enzyme
MRSQPIPIERIGQRFSIRLREPEGGYRDLVGHLKSPSSLINRNGEEISFDPAQIFIWREIIERPKLAGKGAPLTLRVLELDQICNATWPATEELESAGWLMRAANGVTKRANSVLPLKAALADNETSLTEKLETAEVFYRERNLPTIFQLALPTWQNLFDQLQLIGAQESMRANTMVADLISAIPQIPAGFEVFESAQFDQEWLGLQPAPGIETILASCPATYLTIRKNGQVLATARFAVAESWSSITRVFVKADSRGQGLGKAIVEAALAASLAQGATKAVLQVEASNAIAIGIYESLGFNFHHEYVYLELNK